MIRRRGRGALTISGPFLSQIGLNSQTINSRFVPSRLFVQGFLKRRSNSIDGTIPINRHRSITPAGVLSIKGDLIPIETFLHTALWFWLDRFLLCDPSDLRCHEMLRIPKLPRAAVGNPRQSAAAWRFPICCKNRLPNNEHAHPFVRVMRKKLLRCGRPPQTTRSSWRQQ